MQNYTFKDQVYGTIGTDHLKSMQLCNQSPNGNNKRYRRR